MDAEHLLYLLPVDKDINPVQKGIGMPPLFDEVIGKSLRYKHFQGVLPCKGLKVTMDR